MAALVVMVVNEDDSVQTISHAPALYKLSTITRTNTLSDLFDKNV
jgi:hypothetical protein